MHFDIVFLDISANKYYDRQILEKQSLGGTEATVVRVAEGLASYGLKVAVIQSKPEYFEPVMGQFCFFLHSNDIPDITCTNFIQLRAIGNENLFPKARQFLWLHDLAEHRIADWESTLKAYNTTVIGVSRWHRKNIQQHLKYDKIRYVYNPVSEGLYTANRGKVNKDHIGWLASPHKGLGKALELFKPIYKHNPKMKLIVFNPGYMQIDEFALSQMPGVVVAGEMNCNTVWNNVKNMLCVFYPTQWDETFGLIAAESNALGTPIATYRKAALKEIVSSETQMVADNDEAGIIDKVISWSEGARPVVTGREEFRFDTVIADWVQLLGKS